jgi:hypothetical protein
MFLGITLRNYSQCQNPSFWVVKFNDYFNSPNWSSAYRYLSTSELVEQRLKPIFISNYPNFVVYFEI